MNTTLHTNEMVTPAPWRRRFTKLLVLATLCLVFLGGQVKSHEAGLAVPDWPTTYGENMFLFHPDNWVGGIFHEHLHRLVASGIGMLTIILCVWMKLAEPRAWVRKLSYLALVAVIVQGLLGGLTVMMMLPDVVSISHAVLAQSFFVLTIIIAYSQSSDRAARDADAKQHDRTPVMGAALVLFAVVYAQLILGATMRHTEAGLAIPDFPSTAGRAVPWVDRSSVEWVNNWRDEYSFDTGDLLDPVSFGQVVAHYLHRLGALAVLAGTLILGYRSMRNRREWPSHNRNAMLIAMIVGFQLTLGVATVLSMKAPVIASLHVVTGAATLGLISWLVLRTSPLSFAAWIPDESADTSGGPVSAT